jgi:hypothetical protein
MMAMRVMAQHSPARIHFSPTATPSRTIAKLASRRGPRTVPRHTSLPYRALSVSAWKAISLAETVAV